MSGSVTSSHQGGVKCIRKVCQLIFFPIDFVKFSGKRVQDT